MPTPAFQRLIYSGLEPSQAFDVVYGAHFEHRLLAAGHAEFEHQRLVIDDVRLESGRYDFPVIARGAMPRDTICVGFVVEGVETTRYNLASLAPDEVQVYPKSAELLYHAGRASRWILFGAPESHLQEVALARTGRPLPLPTRDAVSVKLPLHARLHLAQVASDALGIGRHLQRTGISSALGREIARGLTEQFVDALCESDLERNGRLKVSATAQAHFHLLLACERLAISSDEIDVSLNDIARRSGYSRRALEIIFRQSVGMPPGRWFMNMRLNAALRDLLTPTPQCRVSEVATRWGFRHLPRFAERYRQAFGELPSATLHRARRVDSRREQVS